MEPSSSRIEEYQAVVGPLLDGIGDGPLPAPTALVMRNLTACLAELSRAELDELMTRLTATQATVLLRIANAEPVDTVGNPSERDDHPFMRAAAEVERIFPGMKDIGRDFNKTLDFARDVKRVIDPLVELKRKYASKPG